MNNEYRNQRGSRGRKDGGRGPSYDDDGRIEPEYYSEKKDCDKAEESETYKGCNKHGKHDQKFCIPTDVALDAATGGAGPLPIIVLGDLVQPLPVVSVTIDAGCICDPSVLLRFTTLINLPTGVEVTVVASLSFEVLRSSGNGTPVRVGPTFTYATTAATLVSDSFSFQLFDSELQSGTYTYTVLLTTNTAVDTAGVTLINSTLSALAVNDV